MTDPVVARWALHRLDQAREAGNVVQERALLDLFDEEVTAWWLFGDDAALAARVAETLPPGWLRPLTDRLLAGWHDLPDAVAGQVLAHLAALDPQRVLALVEEAALTVPVHRESPRVAGVTRAIRATGPEALPALRTLLKRHEDASGWMLHWRGLLAAAVALHAPEAPRLLAHALTTPGNDPLTGEAMLAAVYRELAPQVPFFTMLCDIEFRRLGYRFTDLPELFAPDAPLEMLDRLAEHPGADQMHRVLRLLRHAPLHPRLAALSRRMVRRLPPDAGGTQQRLAFLFVLAGVAAQHVRTRFDWDSLVLQQRLDVLTADVPELPGEAALCDSLATRLCAETLPVFHRELTAARFYRGAARLIRLLARYGAASSIPVLVECLSPSSDEETARAACLALAGFGDAAVRYLANRFDALDDLQRIWALEVLAAAGTQAAAQVLLDLHPCLAADRYAFDFWLAAAEAVPDPRFLPLIAAGPGSDSDAARRAGDRIRTVVQAAA